MRCLSCNVVLSDAEATRKYTTGEFVDLCDDCYKHIEDEVPTLKGYDGPSDQEGGVPPV